MNVPAMTRDYTPSQLMTIKNTVAADANEKEFDLFLNAARNYGLDPFRKQIVCVIFGKNDEKRRKQAIIVTEMGLQSIAQRCGDYRPAASPPQYEIDESLKGPNNPAGIVSCTVAVHKQDSNGDWNPVVGHVYWEEFAPLKEVWEYNQESGRREPTGRFELDTSGNWGKMPRRMIAKCANCQALRAGWPNEFGGLYDEAELDHMRMKDITPSQEIIQEEQHRRENALGGKGIMMVFDPSKTFERVPVGKVFDRCCEFIEANDAEEIYRWSIQNREPLREFWAHSPHDANELKAVIEKKTESIGA